MSRLRWKFLPHDAQRIQALERSAGISPVVAQIFAVRGVSDPRQVQSFLNAALTDLHPPDQLPNVQRAAELIVGAIQQRQKIAIYGDYDADGITATAILVRCLRLLGAEVCSYVPNRLDDGYGLNHAAIERLHNRQVKLIVTVDCGIASLDEAQRAHQIGLQLVITDHHQMADQLPQADAIVHPRLPHSHYPFDGICGAGVALKLAWAVCQRASGGPRVKPPLREYLMAALGLAAIGTVADMVPLLDENRVIVRHGLVRLLQSEFPGIQALLRIAKLDEKTSLDAEDIAFSLAPRLNAAGRLGQAQLAVELLTTDQRSRAEALADYIDQLNNSRDSLERSIFLAANKQVKQHHWQEEPAIVLAGRGWHAGVIGIVAGRIAEKYLRPTVIISLDEMGAKPGVGSARTVGEINIYQALQHCRDQLLGFGGHRAAAGIKIDESQVDQFRHQLCEHVSACAGGQPAEAELVIDVEAPLSQLTLRTLDEIEKLAPFGQQNPRPVLCATSVDLVEAPKKIGGGQRHMSVRLKQHQVKLRAVAFGKGLWAEQLSEDDGPYDFAFRPVINQFRGRRSVEMQLIDWRPAKNRKPSPQPSGA